MDQQPSPASPPEGPGRGYVAMETARREQAGHYHRRHWVPNLAAMPDDANLHSYFSLLRRHFVIVIVTALVVAGAAVGGSFLQTPRYRASAKVLFAPAVIPSAASLAEDPARTLDTLVALATTSEVLRQAAAPFDGDVVALRKSLKITADPNADLITIAATSTSSDQAARVANAVTKAFISWRTSRVQELIQARISVLSQQLSALAGSSSASDRAAAADLRTQLAENQAQLATPSADLALVESATPPASPYMPHPYRNGVIGFLVGIVLGITFAFVRERLDRRLRTVEEIEEIYGCPTLGVVPFVEKAGRGNRAEALGDFSGSSPVADAFRTIRTNLSLFQLDAKESRVIVISSAVPEEGKSAATANLAAALATSGKRVLAISADVHAPTLHEYFRSLGGDEETAQMVLAVRSLRSHYGMIDVLSGEVPLAKAAREIPLKSVSRNGAVGKLTLLANARRFSDPAVLYQSSAMTKLLEEAKQSFDVIVIDAPPLLTGGESSVLALQADAVLIVARLDRLTRDGARRAVRLMDAAQIVPLGLVVTGRLAEHPEYYGYGYRSARTT